MRKAAIRFLVLLFVAAIGYLFGVARPVTLVSLSPDDSHRVKLVEWSLHLDRNFDIRLEELRTGKISIVFRSPDEGVPVGSERVVWSVDGSRFLLLGRHFFVTERGKLSTGEKAYLMMDIRSGQIWCNASQQSQFPGFGIMDLRAIQWFGWTPA